MTAAPPVASPTARRAVGPFVVFGLVAMVAALGAIFEISYWVGVSATSPGVIGTAVGIGAALVGFFTWGLVAPRNE